MMKTEALEVISRSPLASEHLKGEVATDPTKASVVASVLLWTEHLRAADAAPIFGALKEQLSPGQQKLLTGPVLGFWPENRQKHGTTTFVVDDGQVMAVNKGRTRPARADEVREYRFPNVDTCFRVWKAMGKLLSVWDAAHTAGMSYNPQVPAFTTSTKAAKRRSTRRHTRAKNKPAKHTK